MLEVISKPWRWGLFHHRNCRGALIIEKAASSPKLSIIYAALMDLGFRETIWQFVYSGQIGGLVRTYGRGLIEVHIRFFEDDAIFAELEIGRTGLAHFLNRRIFANSHIIKLLEKSMDREDFDYLCRSIEKYKSSLRRETVEWLPGVHFLRKIRLLRLQRFLGSWLFISLIMVTSVASINTGYNRILYSIIPVLILIYTASRSNRY